jgi:hypothetical protein
MCDNPSCDICGASPAQEGAAPSDEDADRTGRPRIGLVNLSNAVMAGATALRFWHFIPR